MATPAIEGLGSDKRSIYVQALYAKSLEGDINAHEELGRIAAGRNDLPLARELFSKIEAGSSIKKEEL